MTRTHSLAIAVAFTTVAGASHAAPRCVNPASKACFTTIGDAVAAAGPGDVITVSPGVYREAVEIPAGKDGLQINGTSAAAVVVDPDGIGGGFGVSSNNVKLQRMTIRNGGVGVVVRANNTTLQGLRIFATFRDEATGVRLFPGVTGTQILSNELRAIGAVGITTEGPCDGTIVKSNTFASIPTAVSITGNNVRVQGNKLQVVRFGIVVSGDAPTITDNVFENMTAGMSIVGRAPIVDRNRGTVGGVLAGVTCQGCAGGSVSGNVGTGIGVGLEVDAPSTGLAVENNTMTDSATAFLLDGAFEATSNVASGATSICFDLGNDGANVSKNVAKSCGGVAYRVTGGETVLTNNTATDSGAFGFMVTGANNTLNGNKASGTDGQGFGIVGNTATGNTLTGNSGSQNRLDFCNDSGAAPTVPIPGNTFATQSTTCDVPFVIL